MSGAPRLPSLPARQSGTHWLTGAACCAAWAVVSWPGMAGAQVLRCTDPSTGKVTYTDGACGSGTAAREVEPRKSAEQLRQEREQAAEALERRHERLQAEAEQDRRDEARSAREARNQPRNDNRADPSQSAQCQRARRELQEVTGTLGRGMVDEAVRLDSAQRQADQACLSPAAYLEAERSRTNRPAYATPYSQPYPNPYYAPPVVVVPPRPAPTRPPEITQCNVFRCHDRQGHVYPR